MWSPRASERRRVGKSEPKELRGAMPGAHFPLIFNIFVFACFRFSSRLFSRSCKDQQRGCHQPSVVDMDHSSPPTSELFPDPPRSTAVLSPHAACPLAAAGPPLGAANAPSFEAIHPPSVGSSPPSASPERSQEFGSLANYSLDKDKEI